MVIFSTNHCPRRCPDCISASCPENDNFLSIEDLKDIKKEGVHLCGGEPLSHPRIMDIIDLLYSNNNKICLYTSYPDTLSLEELSDRFPKVGIRLSVSEYIERTDPSHIDRVSSLFEFLSQKNRQVIVTTYDSGEYPKKLKVLKLDRLRAGEDGKPDVFSRIGPLMNIVYSDGTREKNKLIMSHYKEAEKSKRFKK
jgi:MoaA/NifB/PqqE/SkfB family radical SAM enzyme